MNKLHRMYVKARIALVHWELRRLEAHRRRTVAEFMLAVDDGRHTAQELHFMRGQYIARRKAELENTLRQLKKELQ
ncbi:hypothetical protein GTP44_01130 [Duganella sp. FT50W]|jgi:hypothetical protein|uniref:Uncharacterized protein n=1 Tax=Duganella lactea TaxID=2692173 RepID=A0A6L8MFM1_9BURK|nr:hypothetical protein [Duganella lactea]MYM80562.1 hypothetical protein [Duganella lactea]